MTSIVRSSAQKADRAQRLSKIFGYIAVGIVIVALSLTVFIIAYRQQGNTETLKQVKETNQFLINCTTPGHKCYDDATKNGKSRSTEIETVVKQTIIATGVCRGEGKDATFAILNACVDKIIN